MPNELHKAAADKKGLATVKKLIEEDKVDVNLLHDQHKDRAVAYAAQKGSLETLKYLIEEAKADIKAHKNENLLHHASWNTADVIAYLCCPHAQRYKEFKDGTTDLHVAIVSGRLEDVTTILTQDPQRIHELNHNKEGPLYWAVKSNQSAMINYVLTFDGVDSKSIAKNHSVWHGYSPLHFAVFTDLKTAVQTLLAARCDANEPIREGSMIGYAPIHIAARLGYTEIVQLLLAAQVNPNEPIKFGEMQYLTPLFFATYNGCEGVVRTLLAAKVSPNQTIKKGEYTGSTPTIAAADEGHSAIVQMLLDSKADPNETAETNTPSNGYSLIHYATHKSRSDTVKTLVAAKANPNKTIKANTSWNGYAPIHMAAEAADLATVQALITVNADPRHFITKGKMAGRAPLHLAAQYGQAEVVQCLLEAKVNPNETAREGKDEGWTALFLAVENTRSKAVEVLLAGKANPNEPLKKGPQKDIPPIFLAEATKNPALVKTLCEAKALPISYYQGLSATKQMRFLLTHKNKKQPPAKKAPLVKNESSLTQAINAIFSSSPNPSSEVIAFDKASQSEFRTVLKEKCQEKGVSLTKDKLKEIINALRAKAVKENICAQDITEITQEFLYQKKSDKLLGVKRNEVKEDSPKTIAAHYDNFQSIIHKINDLMVDFDKFNQDSEDFSKKDLPKQLKTAYATYKNFLLQYDTNKKCFDRIKNKCPLKREARATVENLRVMNTLIDEANLLRNIMNDTVRTLKSQHEDLAQDVKRYQEEDKNKDKKPNKNEDKTVAVLVTLQNKKLAKEKKRKQQPKKQTPSTSAETQKTIALLVQRGSAIYCPSINSRREYAPLMNSSAEMAKLRA